MSKGNSHLFEHTIGADIQLINELNVCNQKRYRTKNISNISKSTGNFCSERVAWLRLFFEYCKAPLQWHDDESGIIRVGLPPRWSDDVMLEAAMHKLCEVYDSLFIKNKNEYSFAGFRSEEEQFAFYNLADIFAKMIYQKNNGEFTIVNDLYLGDWRSTISD